ncbi:UNVERIFIED_CONTAM: hypothetical protein Slati_3761100 [Sesamum latifolium]|uniref:Uncharacterized protein n=1 Tax=Sesamum latifolium TaxID=2727402 RepID=A0AAW2U3N0_9LAMI
MKNTGLATMRPWEPKGEVGSRLEHIEPQFSTFAWCGARLLGAIQSYMSPSRPSYFTRYPSYPLGGAPCSCAHAGIAERKVGDLRQRLAAAATREKELGAQKASLEDRVKELEDQVARSASEVAKAKDEAFKQSREEGFSAGEAAGVIVGQAQGRDEFTRSEEYRTSLASSHLQGARDFLKSSAFDVAVEIKAASFVNDGFKKCKAQVVKLRGFADGFDSSLLDPTLDNNLEPYPEMPEEAALPDEFDALIADVENLIN